MPRTIFPQYQMMSETPTRCFELDQPVESQMVHCEDVMRELGESRDLMKLEMEQNKCLQPLSFLELLLQG